jgi:four helix bundle protein
MGDFRRLRVWREAKRLAVLSRDAIRMLPQTELYALGAQWRRAAYSVSLNIAEGAGQPSRRQFARYLNIALGSVDELQGIFEFVGEMGYVGDPQLAELRTCRTHCARLLIALIRSLDASSGNA